MSTIRLAKWPSGDSDEIPFSVRDRTGRLVPLLSATLRVVLPGSPTPYELSLTGLGGATACVFPVPPDVIVSPAETAVPAAIEARDTNGGKHTQPLSIPVSPHV